MSRNDLDREEMLPVDVAVSEYKALQDIGHSLGAQCIRSVNIGGMSVFALECPGFLGIGGKVWSADSYALTQSEKLNTSIVLS